MVNIKYGCNKVLRGKSKSRLVCYCILVKKIVVINSYAARKINLFNSQCCRNIYEILTARLG